MNFLFVTSALATLSLVTATVTLLVNLKTAARIRPLAELETQVSQLSIQVSDLADFTERRERRERVRRLRDGREAATAEAPQTPEQLKAALRRAAFSGGGAH